MYDQRMQRICNSLQKEFSVELVGRYLPNSPSLSTQSFLQTRLTCFFNKGFLFYAEFNIRLFFYLLLYPFDIVCGCDLDTLPAAVFAAKLKMKKVVYDAHEYFPESPELIGRKKTQQFWFFIEKIFVPMSDKLYTVCDSIATIFNEKYNLKCHTIRNLPYYSFVESDRNFDSNILLYQGAVNIGRGLKEMIDAMIYLSNFELHIAGDGDIKSALEDYVKQNKLDSKVKFLGKINPDKLKQITRNCFVGINILENIGLSYYYSLGNKTFDYLQASVPQILINFPEYKKLNDKYSIGVLVNDLNPQTLSEAVLNLKNNEVRYRQFQNNCQIAARDLCWENEEEKLLMLYRN